MERKEYTFTIRTDVARELAREAEDATRDPSQQLEHILKERYAALVKSDREYVMERPLVQVLGDGSRLCEQHWRDLYPDTDPPTYGWVAGECDECEADNYDPLDDIEPRPAWAKGDE